MKPWFKKKPKIKLDKIIFRVGKLTIRPGDFLVLATPLMLDKDQVQLLRERAEEQFKDLGVKVVILTSGFNIAVLRKENADVLDQEFILDRDFNEVEGKKWE